MHVRFCVELLQRLESTGQSGATRLDAVICSCLDIHCIAASYLLVYTLRFAHFSLGEKQNSTPSVNKQPGQMEVEAPPVAAPVKVTAEQLGIANTYVWALALGCAVQMPWRAAFRMHIFADYCYSNPPCTSKTVYDMNLLYI